MANRSGAWVCGWGFFALLLEGFYRFGLNGVDLADGDCGEVKIFTASGRTGDAAEHGELASVAKRICDGALHEPVNMHVNFRGRRKVGVKGGKCAEEALLLLWPRDGLGVVPGGIALGHGERPVEQVAHVSEDLHRAPAGAVKVGEGFGCEFQGANGAVGKCGKGVAKKVPFFIHCGTITH
jgi:hypothetical protein